MNVIGRNTFLRFGALLLASSSFASAELAKSGHAGVELVAEKGGYEAAKTVRVAIRMVVDPHWHTYWENPGEGGMKLQLEWQNLPEGWKAGEVGYPVPKRMKTGDLPGFGYEGEVWFPVELTAGAASGPVELVAKVGWLTCNDDACIPGDATVKVLLEKGDKPGSQATAVAKAFDTVPQPWTGAKLSWEEREGGKKLLLKLVPPAGNAADLSAAEVYPATETALDPGEVIRLRREGNTWTAEVKKNAYASAPLKELRLVLSGGGLAKPVSVAGP